MTEPIPSFEVPDELADPAAERLGQYRDLWHDERGMARYMLAAVLPLHAQQVREQIAAELERAADIGYPANAAWVLDMHQATHIVRGGLNGWLAENGRRPDGSRQDGQRQPWEPIRDEQDLAELTATPDSRLTAAELALWQSGWNSSGAEPKGETT